MLLHADTWIQSNLTVQSSIQGLQMFAYDILYAILIMNEA